MNDFRRELLKVSSKRNHKIKGSLGINDAFKYYKQNGGKLPNNIYNKIIKTINKYYAQQLSNGIEIKLPCRMGSLELRKFKPTIKIKDNKLINTLPIDWNRTLKLWEEDKQAKEQKIFVKLEVKEVFRVVYNKKTANYKNKSFFKFKTNRQLKLNLKHNIMEGAVDAFLWNG